MMSRLLALPARELWLVEAPTLLVSLVIAEVFYKFGSFMLEAVAMLATWWLLSSISRRLVGTKHDAT